MSSNVSKPWVQRFAAIRRPKPSLSSQVEEVRVVTARLGELHENLEQIHCKIESLEIQLHDQVGRSEKGTSLLRENGEARLDSDYWIG